MDFLQYIEKRLSPPQIVVLSFLLLIVIGAVFLALPVSSQAGGILAPLDALFTATSAVCVTGLAVVDTGVFFSRFGQVVLLLLIQFGGLGLMTIATLYWLVFGRRIQLRERLLMQESLNLQDLSGVVRLVRSILLVTFLVEGVGAALLALWFIPRVGVVRGCFFGVFHAISAFCNAGFDLLGGFRSFTLYVVDPFVNLVLMALIVIGGLGFAVLVDIYRYRRYGRLTLHSHVVVSITGALLFLGFVVFLALEWSNPATLGPLGFGGKVVASLFQSVSPRTAGFSTIDVADMKQETQLFLVFLMLVGASPGSTGGGIKTATLGTLLAAIYTVATGRAEIDIFQRRLPQQVVFRSLAIMVLFLVLLLLNTILLAAVEGTDLLPLLFEVASALGTVGLSTGITPQLTSLGKVIIIVTMFLGRVGPLTLVLALGQREHPQVVKYPEEKLIVG